jgi:hypothetical protein
VIIRFLERPEPPENVGRLANHQTQVGQIQWNVLEAEDWSPLGLVPPHDAVAQRQHGKGHAALNPAFDFEQLEMQVDGIRELGMRLAKRPQLHDLRRLGPGCAGGADRFGHALIIYALLRVPCVC